ncbi:MAG: hypothetical protein WCO12_03925 [bacterium]
MKNYLIYIFLFFCILFIPNVIHAETRINGAVISTNTTWKKENGPYIVSGYVLVNSGVTLNIAAGTIVKFDKDAQIGVVGKLIIGGLPISKVYLTSLYDDGIGGYTEHGWGKLPQDNKWQGIEVLSTGNLQASYADIYYAKDVFNFYHSTGSLGYVSVYKSESISYMSESTLMINNSYFENIINGIAADYLNNLIIKVSSFKNIENNLLNISNGGTLTFEKSHVDRVSYGTSGSSMVRLLNKSSGSLVDSSFENIGNDYSIGFMGADPGYAVEVNNNSSLVFLNSSLENTTKSAAIKVQNEKKVATSTLTLQNSTISDGSGNGLEISNNSSVGIYSSKIQNFLQSGIKAYSGAIVKTSESEISGNDIGIESIDADVSSSYGVIKNNNSFGVSNNDGISIKALYNWWGNIAGPFNSLQNSSGLANKVSNNVEFLPWQKNNPDTKGCCSNVVFIPGIESSRLYKKGLFSENQLWEPNRNADVEKLYLDKNGNSLDQNIYTRDILKRTNIMLGILDVNVYKTFTDTMDDLVNQNKINAWEALPYDWRYDINKIVADGVKLEDGKVLNFVDEIIKSAGTSQTGKVTIVTHSNGGLVAKVLIDELKKRGLESLVDNLIMVAAPELGTPSAIAGLLHGDDQDIAGGFILKKTTARTLGENMMGAYNLLPGEKYFSKVLSPVVVFDSSIDKIKNYREKYGDTINSYPKLRDFILGGDGRKEPEDTDTTEPNVLKSDLLNLAKLNHENIDDWTPPAGIKVTELAGWGIKTTSGIRYKTREECIENTTFCVKKTVLDREPILTEDGDKTVVSPSATDMGVDTYYLNMKSVGKYTKIKPNHANILESNSSVKFIENIILQSNKVLPDYITIEKPVSIDKTLELMLHSPVSIDIYDEGGNHTGIVKNQNPDSDLQMVEENIPGSRYIEFGEGKYVYLDSGKAYTVKLQGLDIGTFTLEAKLLSPDGSTESESSFVDIPTSPKMQGEIIIASTTDSVSSTTIKIDVNQDSKTDINLSPGQNFDSSVYSFAPVSIFASANSNARYKISLQEILYKKEVGSIIVYIQKIIDAHKKDKLTQKDLDKLFVLIKSLTDYLTY